MSFSNWTPEDVCKWLGNLSMHHLVPNFERLQIDGLKLVKLSDQELRGALRLTKPAEVMAIRGAINKLIDDATKPVYHEHNRRVSATPRVSAPLSPRVSAPLSPRDRSGSVDRKMSRTVPRDLHRNTTIASEPLLKQPKLVQGSAPALIDNECKYSGWIRKQGGGFKNWKRRYLILRLGCLYYFPNETASTAKGSFVLSGYKSEICREPEIVKKYKYTLKLCPMNPQVRTYYISVGSERELIGWKEAIDNEIRMVSRRTSLEHQQNSMDTMTTMNSIAADDDDDDDDDEDNPYDVPEGFQEGFQEDEDEHNYDDPTSLIYDKPDGVANDDAEDEDEDDPYTKIDDGFSQALAGRFPTVPTRSAYSLQSPTNVSAALHATRTEAVENPDDTYLPIIAGGPAKDLIAAQPDLSRTSSPPMNNNTIASSAPPIVGQFGHDDHDYEDDGVDEGDREDDDDGGYYIMFRKPEELMPQSCLFNRLERPEADRLLKDKNRDGTYLIRGGSHAGAEKVLSVWHIDRCRHYKLFKDENSSFSLTQGQSFRTIPELLQYYTLQSHLPKSEFYLGDPFNPEDH